MRRSSHQDGPPTPKRRRRWVRWLFLGLLLAALAPLGAVSWLCTAEPCYWQIVEADDPEVQRDAERVERTVSSQLTRVRDTEGVWKLRLSEDQINRWLATRLPQWLRNRGLKAEVLDQIEHPMFDADEGLLRLAARVSASALLGVVQVGFEPHSADDDQPVRLKLAEARIGKLPVSINLLTKAMVHGFGANKREGERIRDILNSIEMKLPLGDGRRVDVVGLEPRENGLILSCRTVRIEKAQRSE